MVGHIREVGPVPACYDRGVQELRSSAIEDTVETFDEGLVELR